MKRQRKSYQRPFKRWDKSRIKEERQLMKDYGLHNKKELWKAADVVRAFRSRARRLFTEDTGREELFGRLQKLGMFTKEATLDDVLGLKVKDVLERRLQTMVLRKGLASTPNQARQLIVHRHVQVGGRVVDVPSYMVTVDEEDTVAYAGGSPVADEDHPIHSAPKVVEEAPEGKEEAKAEGKEKPEATAKAEAKPEGKKEAKAGEKAGKEAPKKDGEGGK
jgi:small subunit ribosomal protein S4